MFFEYIDGNSLAILGAAIAALAGIGSAMGVGASLVRRLPALLQKRRPEEIR